MRAKLKILPALFGLLMCGSVYAEGSCPDGYTPYNYGATVGCVPGGNDPQAQSQTQMDAHTPSGAWQKTWGAIAADGVNGSLGVAVGASSKENAESTALADCHSKGGNQCVVSLAYFNQCAAMVVGSKNYNSYSAATIEEAKDIGLKSCNASDANCRVFYADCSKPDFVRN